MDSFESLMSRAKFMCPNEDYKAGYIRGLRRAHHGDKFGTEDEHNSWLTCGKKGAQYIEQERGYKDGLSMKPPAQI